MKILRFKTATMAFLLLTTISCGTSKSNKNDKIAEQNTDEKGVEEEESEDKSHKLAEMLPAPEVAYPQREADLRANGWSANLITCRIRKEGWTAGCKLKKDDEVLYESESGEIEAVDLEYMLSCDIQNSIRVSLQIVSRGSEPVSLVSNTLSKTLSFQTAELSLRNDKTDKRQFSHINFNVIENYPCDLRVRMIKK